MRRGARSALVVGAALAAMAVGSAARADVRTINLDGCSGRAALRPRSMTRRPPRAARPPRSRSPGPAAEPITQTSPVRLLVLDRRTTPAVLTNGLPSPLASADAVPGGVSPYDYFEDVIDIPLSADARAEFAAASFFLFAPSLLGRLSLTDVLSAGSAFFGRYSPHSPPPSM